MDQEASNSKANNVDNNKTKINDSTDNEMPWQNQATNLNDSIAYLLNNQLMSDVQFHVEDPDKDHATFQIFHAHKSILSMRSSVFAPMFNRPERSTKKLEIIKILGIHPENFSDFLKFLYTDLYVPCAENLQGACGVLQAAIEYNIPNLTKQCREFIKANIHPSEVFAIKRIATLICPEVVSICNVMMDKEAAKIIQSEEFLTISNEELCEYLKRDGLEVCELDLFRAVLKWATKRCKSNNISVPTPKAVRDALGQALFLIRFPRMTLSDFAVHVMSQELLTMKEAHDVLYYLALKAANNPSLELPKTAFNCAKRMEPVTRKCRSCSSGSLLVFGSICPNCGKSCDY